MSSPEDKASKVNGIGPPSMQRLSTFRPPRDLTLGGVKPNKKLFTPNLNVTRNKNKGAAPNAAKDSKRDDKNKKDHKKERNKNIRNGQNVIKSGGIFAEGVGSIERHSSRAFYGRNSESTSSMQKPTLKPVDFSKLSANKSQNNSIDNDKDVFVDDFKLAKALDAPIKLPMDFGYYPSMSKSKHPFKNPVVVKTEPGLDPDVKLNGAFDFKPEPYEDADGAVDLMRREQPTLILVKLPYSLPGRVGGGDDEPRKRHVNGNTTVDENKEKKSNETKAENECQLRNLGDGKIGKIRIHRSGRVTLALGDSILDVNSGTTTTFYQELVSVAADEERRSASIINLGQLQHKMTVSPEWEPIVASKPV